MAGWLVGCVSGLLVEWSRGVCVCVCVSVCVSVCVVGSAGGCVIWWMGLVV